MLPPSIFRLKSSVLSRSLRLISTRTRRLLSSAPWLTLPPSLEGDDVVHHFYSLADDKVLSFNRRSKAKESKLSLRIELPDDDSALVGSSHGWLALHTEHNGHMFLYNPISGRIIRLPPVTNLLDPDDFRLGLRIPKFILSCSPDDDGECRAMISFGRGDRLAFCLPCVSAEWTPIGISDVHVSVRDYRRYQDFVYSPTDKLFTCVSELNINVWDLREPRAPRVEPARWMPWWGPGTKQLDPSLKIGFDEENYPWPNRSDEDTELKCSCRKLKYLIPLSDGQLFLMIRYVVERMASDGSPYFKPDPVYIDEDHDDGDDDHDIVEVDYPYKTIGFDVHRVDRGDEKWRLSYMEDCLDGMAMFVGSNQSFALSAAEFPELKPDAIYFTDDKDLSLYNPPAGRFTSASYGGHDVGIFDYENRTISSCYYPSDYHSIKRIVPPPLWFTPTNKPK